MFRDKIWKGRKVVVWFIWGRKGSGLTLTLMSLTLAWYAIEYTGRCEGLHMVSIVCRSIRAEMDCFSFAFAFALTLRLGDLDRKQQGAGIRVRGFRVG